ncbi:MAG: ABC transporter permease [Thermoguttaceae bacterium]|nr:ABC transporter permease [Thermoguttaceae bacterium]
MKLRRLVAVARKESLHVLRDPRSLGMGIFIPMLMLVLYGYALTLDVDNVPLLVWDQSRTETSRELVSRFDGSRYFTVVDTAFDYRTIEQAIDKSRAMGALVIPSRFAERMATGAEAPVQLIVDASDSTTATLAISYAEAVIWDYTREKAVEQIRVRGGPPLRIPLDVRSRVWFNEDLKSRNFIVPGLIAVIMMVIAALLTSLTVAREWERGTMEQLISTPVKGYELILGKLVPYFAIGMFDMLVAVLMGEFVFDIPLRGSVTLLFATAALFLVGVLAMGVFISVVTKNQTLASQLAMVLTFLPAFLLSGFIFAISNMPLPIQKITHIVPARYFVALLKGIYLKGVGPQVLAGEIALLSAFTAIMLALAIGKFKKKLA